MRKQIEGLVAAFESGRLTRRQLVCALTAMAGGAQALRSEPLFTARNVNHATLSVADVERSKRFYQRLFGAIIRSEFPDGCNLGMGPNFLGLFKKPKPGLVDHVCIGIDGYDVHKTATVLKQNGIEPEIANGDQVFFRDPDNIRIQLADADYRG
jgi:catechol 2,3-dioxygenase-like lactoylglutathione lyase family enzyme